MSLSDLSGKRVLVTGATGFIGSRVVERLSLDHKAEVVALVHQFKRASRLARFPLQMVGGDVTDAACVAEAAAGCQAIIHCAVSFAGSEKGNRRTTVEGVRNVCLAAKREGARVVHLSTFSVYGVTPAGLLDEAAPKNPKGDCYGSSKLEAEGIVQDYQRQGLQATILQPTIVYGPWSFWSTFMLTNLASGTVRLPDDGRGVCNAVYVDDVVDAIFLAVSREAAALGPFLIGGPKPVSWRDCYEAHAAAMPSFRINDFGHQKIPRQRGVPPWLRTLVRRYSSSAARGYVKQVIRAVRGTGATLGAPKIEGLPDILPLHEHLSLLNSRTEVTSAAASRDLGYRPRFTLAQGSELTAAWGKWVGYGRTKC